MGKTCFKLVQTSSNFFKLAQTCLNLFKLIQTCSILFKLVQTCYNLLKLLPFFYLFLSFSKWLLILSCPEAWTEKFFQSCFFYSKQTLYFTEEIAGTVLYWFSDLNDIYLWFLEYIWRVVIRQYNCHINRYFWHLPLNEKQFLIKSKWFMKIKIFNFRPCQKSKWATSCGNGKRAVQIFYTL